MEPCCINGHAEGLTDYLRSEGYVVSGAALDGRRSDAEEALASLFDGRPPDILLADLCSASDCLPLQHARRLFRSVWGEDVPPPLTLALFQPRHLALPDWPAYVDDFLTPPHAPREILARLSLLLFRRRHVLTSNVIRLPGITIDLDIGRAFDDGNDNPIDMTPREFELLKFLATHRGKYFPRARLLDFVWGIDFDGGERTVDIHIRRLRAKLPHETTALLDTQRGLGYGFRSQ